MLTSIERLLVFLIALIFSALLYSVLVVKPERNKKFVDACELQGGVVAHDGRQNQCIKKVNQ